MAIATKLPTIKKKVLKKYPNAFVQKLPNNRYTICQELENLSLNDILAELFLPPALTPEDAWITAAQVVRIQQNIDRTHPLRLEGMQMEDKLRRIEMRKMRGKKELPKKQLKKRI